MDKKKLAVDCASIIEKEGIKCAVVGAIAVIVWTEERFTKDVDFALAVKSDKDAEKIIKVFRNNGFELTSILEHKPTDSISVAMLNKISASNVPGKIDLIFKQSGIEKEIVDNSVLFKGDGFKLRVADRGHLIAMKTLSINDERRPNDRSDLANLIKVADKKDIEIAKKAIDLITTRGFNDKKDLHQILKVLLEIYTQKAPSPRLKR